MHFTGVNMLQRNTITDEYVVLQGITPDMFQGIDKAIGECHARMTYDGYRLELRNCLSGVNPANYAQLLKILGDYSLRHTYNGHALEMMSPRKDHDWVKGFLGRLIEATALELNIPVQGICSTTLTKSTLEVGLEPDEAFYIANEHLVTGKPIYEPDIDPPPDLVIEVDVTSASIPRLPLFAELGVPEIWRHVNEEIIMYSLQNGEYVTIKRSVSFPFLDGETLMSYLDMRSDMNDTAVTRKYIKWLRNNPEVPEPLDDE